MYSHLENKANLKVKKKKKKNLSLPVFETRTIMSITNRGLVKTKQIDKITNVRQLLVFQVQWNCS